MKSFFYLIENIGWNLLCSYRFWLHGPYGLARTVEKMPFRYLVKYLRKYGATVGEDCRFERGLNIHRPLGKKPFENLTIGNGVYLGHGTLLDLSDKITIEDNVIIASRCQLWTHHSIYRNPKKKIPEYFEKNGPIVIGSNSIIYSAVVVGRGVNVGKGVRVSAGVTVTDNINDYSILKSSNIT